MLPIKKNMSWSAVGYYIGDYFHSRTCPFVSIHGYSRSKDVNINKPFIYYNVKKLNRKLTVTVKVLLKADKALHTLYRLRVRLYIATPILDCNLYY